MPMCLLLPHSVWGRGEDVGPSLKHGPSDRSSGLSIAGGKTEALEAELILGGLICVSDNSTG